MVISSVVVACSATADSIIAIVTRSDLLKEESIFALVVSIIWERVLVGLGEEEISLVTATAASL